MPIWILACGLLAAGNLELAAARRAGTDKDRVVIFGQQLLQAVDAMAALELDAEVEDVIGFLVDDGIRQAEFRNLRPHHAAGLRVLVEHGAVIPERREIARDRQRGRTAADDRDALAVLRRRARHASLDVILEIGGDALEAADRDRSFLDAAAAAGGFARAIAGASENSRKHVRFPIDHVGVAIAAFGNQADIFRDGGVCGAGPLAVDHFMEVVGRRDISRFHSYLIRAKHSEQRGLILYANAQIAAFFSVLEWLHRFLVLKPIKLISKANFARSSALVSWVMPTHKIGFMRRCSMKKWRLICEEYFFS